jgi:hypothetical protein
MVADVLIRITRADRGFVITEQRTDERGKVLPAATRIVEGTHGSVNLSDRVRRDVVAIVRDVVPAPASAGDGE